MFNTWNLCNIVNQLYFNLKKKKPAWLNSVKLFTTLCSCSGSLWNAVLFLSLTNFSDYHKPLEILCTQYQEYNFLNNLILDAKN